MKKYVTALYDNPLFNGITLSELESLLACLNATTRQYDKDEVIALTGDTVSYVGLVLSGSVRIIREDIDGRVAILATYGVSELFGEVFACAGVVHSPVTIQAAENTEILSIDYSRIITTCTSACRFHSLLIENMLRLLAIKTLMLNKKLEIVTKRTTREKLLAFFDAERGAAKRFTIPYNREELAAYLCVDRSAMSSELGKMRDDGLITYNRNTFEIL